MIEGLQDVLKADSARSTKMDCVGSVEEYINKSDWRISANSNVQYSHAGLINNLAGKAIANFWLDKVYTKKEGDAHRNGDYHIHDLDCLSPYCFTSDTKIKTLEFGDISIKELLGKNVSSFTVISFDGEKKVECNAHDLRCTRQDAELVEVEFEDGLVVRCTPDHKFLAVVPFTNPDTFEAYLKMEWVEAKQLSGMSVRKAYNCSPIKNGVIKLEEIEGVITESEYKNSFARVISVKSLEYTEDVYCMTVDDTHCFALENGVIAHNCAGHDLQDLLASGFNGVVSRVSSKPPKHFREALGQMANFIGILQSEWAGAQAFSSFDTLLAPYVFFDMTVEGLDERDIKKALLSFVYNLNVPSRWGQAPFSNVTIDMTVPQYMRNLSPQRGEEPYFVRNYREFCENETDANKDGWNRLITEARKRLNDFESDEETILYSLTYEHFKQEMMIISKMYYEVLSEGDSIGQPFTFPIPTVNITEDFDWDDPEYEFLFENAARYGSSYFQNFIGSQYLRDEEGKLTIRDENAYSPNDVRSMCCRLQLDRKALRKRGGGLFGSDSRTGSIGVVTINMARLGYLYKGDEKALYKRLGQLMDMARSTLDKKRTFVEEMYLRGLYPYTRRYVPSYDTFFSTIGVNGMNEMVRNFTNDEYDITDPRGQKMALDILKWMNSRFVEWQETGKALWNLEATPAEGCLHFDTKILTIDGAKKIGELCGEQVPVLSYNKDTKRMEYKKANIFFDSVTEKVYKITFDNGYTLECTSEHPFAVRHWNGANGEEMYWSPASALKVGDRIKSAYTNISLHGYKRYGKHFFEHRGVYEYYNGKIPDGYVIHHKDGDKFNNNIDNLMLMTEKEHKSHHIKEMINNDVIKINNEGENNPFYGKKHSDETKQKISESKCKLTDKEKDAIIEAYSAGLEFKQMSRLFGMTTQPMDFIRRIGAECREGTTYPKVNRPAIEYLYDKGYSDEEIVNILRGHNTLSVVRDVILSLTEENHKVVSIEILHKKMPVYNATVEDNQNFYVGDDEMGYVLTHNTTYRFAKEDIKRYPDIIQAGFPDAPYYTNSSQLPVDFSDDVFAVLDLQDDLQKAYTGGTVLHIYNDEDVTAEECKVLLRKVLTNYRLPYVSFTATFSTCPKHGRIPGIHEYCPLCDKELMAKHADEIDPNKA